jgi:hypothetical protein
LFCKELSSKLICFFSLILRKKAQNLKTHQLSIVLERLAVPGPSAYTTDGSFDESPAGKIIHWFTVFLLSGVVERSLNGIGAVKPEPLLTN